jgi:hypothetical protein
VRRMRSISAGPGGTSERADDHLDSSDRITAS